jgi:hypothetical protein
MTLGHNRAMTRATRINPLPVWFSSRLVSKGDEGKKRGIIPEKACGGFYSLRRGVKRR